MFWRVTERRDVVVVFVFQERRVVVVFVFQECRDVLVVFVFLIRHVLSSVLGSETRYPERGISRFPSVSPRNARSALYRKLSLVPLQGPTQNNHVNWHYRNRSVNASFNKQLVRSVIRMRNQTFPKERHERNCLEHSWQFFGLHARLNLHL